MYDVDCVLEHVVARIPSLQNRLLAPYAEVLAARSCVG